MSLEKEQVRKFYTQIWNQQRHDVISEVLHEAVRFRGSLGQEVSGHAGFAEYLDLVHSALGDYECTIEQLVAESNRVFAKMMFTGVHKGSFMGYAPTEASVSWAGAALFTFDAGKVIDLWVLGDLTSLEQQLKNAQA